MSALTAEKFGLTSSTNPFSRRSSYAIVASDEQDVPAAKHLGQKRIRLCSPPLKLRLVEHRVVDLAPQLRFQLRHHLVEVRQIHTADDEHRHGTRTFAGRMRVHGIQPRLAQSSERSQRSRDCPL